MTRSSTSDVPGSEGPLGRSGRRLPASARVRRGRDIRRVLSTGARTRGRFVDVFSAPSPSHRPRIGVIVPRYGNSAAARNLVRRRLRELARREWLPVALEARVETDLVVRAKPSAYGVSYRRLRESLEEPLSRACAR